jgi:transcriptional regulatory protein GAL4
MVQTDHRTQDLTPFSESCPPQLDETTIYSYISTQSAYHLSTIRIYNRLISSPMPSAADLIAMDDELIEGWRQRLPAYFCDQDLPLANEHLLGHSISRWRSRVMRILMYRPFLLRWAQDGFGPLHSSTLPSSPDLSHSATVEDVATIRCFQAAEECIAILYRFWTLGTHTRLAAWYVLYFLLQAALIPVHCLRRNPSHTEAPSWLKQVRTSLDIINAMVNINPSAPKCRDIIHRLCGESLGQELKEDNAGQSGAESFPYDMSGTDLDDPNIESWMTEIETAIDGYDMYCDHLTNAAAPGVGGFGDVSIADEENLTATSAGPSGWGTETSTGVRDWDWGLML